ncbi:gamma-glutamylcyclotransferase [Cereibacter sphaeroides]|uniref:gamma-glutamylcyclotransferase family protein n=1 Tax=Cereibacter sphaeroides TaxID=1063 RepID=UPI000E5ABFC0|nr:gamma-glutamylcyclotransferase family protein [Cereibacter sphaeroides]RHZ92731.1 gamma-glutamylcyclotransferase [Cereibacter sphaeroides]
MTTVLHFAYGIDLHPEEMARMVPTAVPIGRAVLPDHRMGFFGHNRVWDGADETVEPDPGARVQGVLYRLSRREADQFDAARGVKLNGTGTHFHFPVEVRTEDGTSVPALILKKDRRGVPRLPSTEYLARLVEGARAHGLPAAWIAALAATPSVPASHPVPNRAHALQVVGLGCAC